MTLWAHFWFHCLSNSPQCWYHIGELLGSCYSPFEGKLKWRHELAWRHRKCANISICRLHLVVMSIFIPPKLVPFWFEFELFQPCWFTLFQWRAKKGWLMMYLMILLYILALLIMALIRLLETKLALTVMFWGLSNVHKQDKIKSEKLLCMCFVPFLYNMACDTSSFPFPFKG